MGPGGVTQRRVLAYLIDAVLVLWVLQVVLFLIIAEHSDFSRGRSLKEGISVAFGVFRGGMSFDVNGNQFFLEDDRYPIFILACLAVWFLYFGVLQGLTGRTLGKLLTGLRVVQGDGSPLGLGRGIVRTLFLIVDGFPWGTGIVGFIVVVANDRRRRIGDMVADTDVVLAESEPAAPVGPDALYSGPAYGTALAPPAPPPPPPAA